MLANDQFPYGSDHPAIDVLPVDVSGGDQTLAFPCRAIRATGAGNIVIQTALDQKRTLAFLAGETRAVRASKIYQANTTATGIEALI